MPYLMVFNSTYFLFTTSSSIWVPAVRLANMIRFIRDSAQNFLLDIDNRNGISSKYYVTNILTVWTKINYSSDNDFGTEGLFTHRCGQTTIISVMTVSQQVTITLNRFEKSFNSTSRICIQVYLIVVAGCQMNYINIAPFCFSLPLTLPQKKFNQTIECYFSQYLCWHCRVSHVNEFQCSIF